MSTRLSTVGLEFVSIGVNPHTTWTFAEVREAQGTVAIVEITCGDATPDVCKLIAELLAALEGKDIADESDLGALLELTPSRLGDDLALATAVSALRTAVVDIESQIASLSMTEALGQPSQPPSVPLYANVNRSTFGKDRSPRGYAGAAERAVADGFSIVKCAPFDEVHPPSTAGEILDMARPGLERVAAIRSAIGPEVRLLVDCHSRFEEHTAPLIADELARLDVGWFEEPLEPTRDAEALARVARVVGMPLAGGEHGHGEGFFRGLVDQGAVRIVMPDIKYCGGVAEACLAGIAATKAGGQFSLHSPSGPISLLASAHVTAAMPGALALEHAVNEADWRAELLIPAERVEGGRFWFPVGPGLGATLNKSLVTRYGRRWKG